MSMIRGKVQVGKLVQPVVHAGSPTNLRVIDGKLVDCFGRPVKVRPFKNRRGR